MGHKTRRRKRDKETQAWREDSVPRTEKQKRMSLRKCMNTMNLTKQLKWREKTMAIKKVKNPVKQHGGLPKGIMQNTVNITRKPSATKTISKTPKEKELEDMIRELEKGLIREPNITHEESSKILNIIEEDEESPYTDDEPSYTMRDEKGKETSKEGSLKNKKQKTPQ